MTKRDLHRWAYAAAGIAIIVVAMVIYTALDEKETGAYTEMRQTSAHTDPLKQFNTEQEQLRSMQIAQLDEIINSDKSSEAIIESAQNEKLKIVERMETEQLTAGILRARGYTDAAVTTGDGYVTVMVHAGELSASDTARITTLVTERTGIGAENIKIIPIN